MSATPTSGRSVLRWPGLPGQKKAPEEPLIGKEPGVAWSPIDRIGVALCWFCGLMLCAIAGSIVLYMLVRGIQYVSVDALFEHPVTGAANTAEASTSGGYPDPILGTLLLTAIGIAIALPIGVAIAVWLSEYHRPSWLARTVESGVEIVAGTPTIVLAIFGLLVFTQQAFEIFSFTAEGGAVF